MQLSLFSIASVASVALAAPENLYPPSDDVSITGFTVTRDINGNPTSVSLQLDGTHVNGLKCESDNPTTGGQSADRIECDDPAYSFILNPQGANSYYLDVINHYNPGGSGYFSPGPNGVVLVRTTCSSSGEWSVCKQSGDAVVHLR